MPDDASSGFEGEARRQRDAAAQPPDGSERGSAGRAEAVKNAAVRTGRVIAAVARFIARVAAALWANSRAGIERLERILAWARRVFPPETFKAVSDGCVRYGHAGLVTGEILCLLFGLVAAIRMPGWVYLLQGVGLAGLLLVLQFIADRFLHAGESLIKASPSRIGSAAFPDCLCLLAEVSGILFLIGSLAQAGRTGQWSLIWAGIGIWALCDAVAYVALNPAMTNTAIDAGVRAGEEAIGIMSFLVKILVTIVPVAFGAGAVIGAVGLLFGTLAVAGGGAPAGAYASLRLIAFCASLPLAGYLLFAFYHLALDLMRAVLTLPERNAKD